jgi:hypothetical protein
MMLGLFTTTSMVVILPLIPAGPILRGFKFLNWSREIFCAERKKHAVQKDDNKISFFIA